MKLSRRRAAGVLGVLAVLSAVLLLLSLSLALPGMVLALALATLSVWSWTPFYVCSIVFLAGILLKAVFIAVVVWLGG